MLSLEEQVKLTTLLTQPHRFYHNTTHVMASLAEYQKYKKSTETIKNGTDDDEIITRAIWYHDIVYNPYALAGDNERQSAEIAEMEIHNALGDFCAYIQQSTGDAIRATAYHLITQEDVTYTTTVMLDVDLSGLGKEWDVYCLNGENIRKEYFQTSEFDFLQGRITFLEQMLERDRIYYTDYFFSLYEKAARENMSNELSMRQSRLR